MKLSIKKPINPFFIVALFSLFTTPAWAGYNIQARGTTTGPLTSIVNFFQAVVDFLDGPMALAAVVISLVVAIAMWNWSPQGGRAFGVAARACASGILLFNVAAIITWFSGL